jgi:hypothetical protein
MGKYRTVVHGPLVIPARALLTIGQEEVLKLLARPLPAAVDIRLLIDTGSSRSTLIPSVVSHLNPISRGSARIETALAAARTTLFWVRLEFPQTKLEPILELAVARLALPASLGSIHGIIGRDLLKRWESMLYEGRRGWLVLQDRPWSFLRWFRRTQSR